MRNEGYYKFLVIVACFCLARNPRREVVVAAERICESRVRGEAKRMQHCVSVNAFEIEIAKLFS